MMKTKNKVQLLIVLSIILVGLLVEGTQFISTPSEWFVYANETAEDTKEPIVEELIIEKEHIEEKSVYQNDLSVDVSDATITLDTVANQAVEEILTTVDKEDVDHTDLREMQRSLRKIQIEMENEEYVLEDGFRLDQEDISETINAVNNFLNN